ncbi:MAG: hypothetical protein ACR2OV_12330 [Hyphomicrobiaceae bacterium]
MTVLFNLGVLIIEFALIAALAGLAFALPLFFCCATSALVVVVGLSLEWARLSHDAPFFYDDASKSRRVLIAATGSLETFVKAIAAGVAGMLTFLGNDDQRQLVVIVVFAVCIFAGTGFLRRGYYSLGIRPMRWGYFRLSIPLGILFSILLQATIQFGLVEVKTLGELARTVVFDLPERPDVAAVSDLAFNVKQLLDAFVVDVIDRLVGPTWAAVAGVFVSVNVLLGFAIAIHAVVISEVILRLEQQRQAGNG